MFDRLFSPTSSRRRHPAARLLLSIIISLIAHIAIIAPWQWPSLLAEAPIQQVYLSALLQAGKQTDPKKPNKPRPQKEQAPPGDRLSSRQSNWAHSTKNNETRASEPEVDEESPALILEQPLPPEYPSEARLKGLESCVLANVEVSASGEVSKVTILHADIPGVFDQSVIDAQMSARYYPAQSNGRAVPSRALAVAAFVIRPDKPLNCALKYAETARQLLQGRTGQP